jgi:3-dehydroquinate dehydratase-2
MATRIHILNGPNLNMLGTREQSIYGTTTLKDIEADCRKEAGRLGVELTFEQTNHEGRLVDLVQAAREGADGVIINPGGYTHTSVALQDAIRAAGVPVVELHLTNIFAREPFRHHSYVSPVAVGVICGFGPAGYILAMGALAARLASH